MQKSSDDTQLANCRVNIQQRIVRCVNEHAPMHVGVDGCWIDVTHLAYTHPGGSVILEFLGRDATSQFYAFHNPNVLARYKSVGTYDMTTTETGKRPAEMAFLRFVKRLHVEGYFESEHVYYYKKVVFCIAMLLCVILGVLHEYVIVPGIFLGLFWVQSAFLTHDLMHNQIFKKRHIDQSHGWIWGNICLGASSKWWRDEHFEHHAFTNTYLPGIGSTDPQQHEAPLWAQDSALKKTTNPILLKFQHFTFIPILILFGRVAILVASYSMQRGTKEHIGTLLHWLYVALLLRIVWANYSWAGVWTFYISAAMVQGMLGIQLCISHYDKVFIDKEDSKSRVGWLQRQVQVCKDVDCPWWMDWFHGGLNFHRVHHLMPRLSRCRYRAVTIQLDQVLRDFSMTSDTEPFCSAIASTLKHMRKQALLA